jgi:hypothetical protein
MTKINWKYYWESSFHTDMLIDFVEGNLSLKKFVDTSPKEVKPLLKSLICDKERDWYNYQFIQNRAIKALRANGMSVKKVHQPRRIKHNVQ